MRKILKAILFTPGPNDRWGLTALFGGAPGTAKSSIIRATAAQYGLPCVVLSPGGRGEGAFGVMPRHSSTEHGERITYPPPDYVDQFPPDRGGVLFIDDMNSAPTYLHAPLLGILNDREIGTYYFGPRVRVLAAANPLESAAGGIDIPSSVANRSAHLQWPVPSVEEVTTWLLGGRGTAGIDKLDFADEEARVMKTWPQEFAKASGLATGFWKRSPAALHREPNRDDPNASKAWPSLRSWENAICALAGARIHGLDEHETLTLVEGFIGPATAHEFFSFATNLDLPDPAAVLDGSVPFVHDPHRMDRTLVVLNSCTQLVVPPKSERRADRAKALWQMLVALVDGPGADLTYGAAKALMEARLLDTASITVLSKLHPVLHAAGMAPAGGLVPQKTAA